MANLKITIDRGPAETGAETGRIHVGIFHTSDYSPQSLTALMPDSLVKAPRNCSLPEAVPLGANFYTSGRMVRLQQPYVRRRAKPFDSHPVSKSCAIQAYRLWMEYQSRNY